MPNDYERDTYADGTKIPCPWDKEDLVSDELLENISAMKRIIRAPSEIEIQPDIRVFVEKE